MSDGASPWVRSGHAAMRLLASGPSGGRERDAALEVRLDPGYLTYWRQPGDAGLPPRFDTGASRNVAAAQVAFPAPQLLDEEGAQLFGYRERVTFPLRVTLVDPSRPATLAVAADLAICQRVCLPVSATVSLDLPQAPDPVAAAVIAAAAAVVPTAVALGGSGSRAVRRVTLSGPASADLTVQVRVPGPATLFTEGPEGWFFPAVPVAPGLDGSATVSVPVAQRPDGALPASLPLTLTLVDPEGAIEVAARVDAGAATP